MSWATILAVTDGGTGSEAAMKTAIELGQRFGARVDFLHVENDARDLVPYVGEGMSATAMEQIMASVDSRNAARREVVDKTYKRHCSGAGLPEVDPGLPPKQGEFRVCMNRLTGREAEQVERFGRLSDVIVLPYPGAADGDGEATLDAALFGSGRPVLLAPADAGPGLGKTIAVAWDGSKEGACAVTAALPLLAKAEKVVAITAREGDEADPSALARYLAGHGIEAKTWAYTPGSESIADGLLEQADHANADMLVMGAYGHSRLRERILGGATQGVLERSKIPVLMMH
ncbi:universal stress protein [Pelagibius litoralis]|uniref:Universal stress protein n=1 Tax=Pelagibius litoralis TaxID=374515 RepID=A0A967EZB9_9PROT|nr:universal stress protein [Pelagibius litoralis]NIA70145.1 universal stress protein [Pelagibius litoralis]